LSINFDFSGKPNVVSTRSDSEMLSFQPSRKLSMYRQFNCVRMVFSVDKSLIITRKSC
jgi:hypothetical protein